MAPGLHDRSDEDREDLLARHALGLAEPGEQRLLEQHLFEGCTDCAARLQAIAATTGELAIAVRPAPVSAALRERVLAAIDATPQLPAPGFHFVSSDEGVWEPLAPGVQRRALGRDPESRSASFLVRVAPGMTIPAHHHRAAEHCWVVEGDVIVDGRVLRPGDYHRADAGTEHCTLRSEGGCVFLIVEAAASAPRPEA